MSTEIITILTALVSIALGALGMMFYKNAMDAKTKKGALDEAERIVGKARGEAQRIDRESKQRAKDFENRARKTAENDIQKQKQKLNLKKKA